MSQLALPFNLIEKPKYKEYVKQHWNVTFARQKKVSVCAKRIMARVLTQIKDNDLILSPFYIIQASDVISNRQDAKSAYKEIKKSLLELVGQIWNFEDPIENVFVPRALIDTSKTKADDGFETSYKKGLITIVLNKALTPYFIALAHYSIYEANEDYMGFNSWYSMRMFELLAAFKDTGVWIVPIDEYRELMDCKDKYPNVPMLLDRTLREPLTELIGTLYEFTYEPIFEERKEKGRPGIIAVKFNLKSAQPKAIPEEWYQYSDEHKKVLLKLKNFKVSEPNITRYAKAIGITKAKKILKGWEEKERSNRKIDNKEKYCNAVWVRSGKAAINKIANTPLFVRIKITNTPLFYLLS